MSKSEAVEQYKKHKEEISKNKQKKSEQAIQEIENKSNVKKDIYEEATMDFDALQLFFGEDYKVNDRITIKQPTIMDIVEFGEEKIYDAVNIFVANTTTYRLALWDIGKDWNKISDFEMFGYFVPNLEPESTSLLFGSDIDFSTFRMYEIRETEDSEPELILYSEKLDMKINESDYLHMREYLRKMFNIYPKIEKTKYKSTKEALIWEDRQNANMRKGKKKESSLMPLISACLNHPGFKYKTKELKEVGIIEFMDSVQRLQIYESSTALMKGMYSGFIDGSKIKPESYNFMRDINNDR